VGKDPRVSVVAGIRKVVAIQVNKVHRGESADRYEYTVIFFGDNTKYLTYSIESQLPIRTF
jgi:hypothetical protein